MTSATNEEDLFADSLRRFVNAAPDELLKRLKKIAEERAHPLLPTSATKVTIVRPQADPRVMLNLAVFRLSSNLWATFLIHRLFKVGWRRAAAYTVLVRLLITPDADYKIWTQESP